MGRMIFASMGHNSGWHSGWQHSSREPASRMHPPTRGMRISEALPHAIVALRSGVAQADERGRKQTWVIIGGRRINEAGATMLRSARANRIGHSSISAKGTSDGVYNVMMSRQQYTKCSLSGSAIRTQEVLCPLSFSTNFMRGPLSRQVCHMTGSPQPIVKASARKRQTVVRVQCYSRIFR